MKKIPLPIDEHLAALTALIQKESLCLIAASPGSGKTTRLPPALMQSFPGRVLILEPRRIAAVTAALRVCEEEGIAAGDRVGYQIRFEDKTSEKTQLFFLTEALLQRKLIDDPLLEGVDVVILDEFHERSVHTETALALLLELQENFRPELKIIIMSATLHLEALRTALPRACVYEVVAPPHPLEIRRDLKSLSLRPSPDWYERLVDKVREGFRDSPGKKDLLVFLPGVREINELQSRLLAAFAEVEILPLHAQLPIQDQLRVLKRPLSPLAPNANRRRVILSTNVAESALTLDGVDTVIDAGLERIQQLHHKTGHPSLDLVKISTASAIQRAGRAARQGPGLCLELWTTHDELTFAPERLAEIHRLDLSELRLNLALLGVAKPETLPWIDPPAPERWLKAHRLLRDLDLIEEGGRLTVLGQRVARFPLHPRWGKLLATAEDLGVWGLGCEIAALLQNWGQEGRQFSDLEVGLELYTSGRNQRQFGWTGRTVEQLKRLEKPKLSRPARVPSVNRHRLLERILFSAFPDRLSRKRAGQEGNAVMVGGRGLRLPQGHWQNLDGFLALELLEGLKDGETQCSLLFRLSEEFLAQEIEPLSKRVDEIEWSDKDNRFYRSTGYQFQGLWLSNPHRTVAQGADIETALVEVALRKWSEIYRRNESLRNWFLRYHFFKRYENPKDTQDSVTTGENLDGQISSQTLRDILTWACQGERSIDILFTKNLDAILEQVLLGTEALRFQKSCPEFIVTPRQRRATVFYPEPGGVTAPRIEVRIQDAFGWPETPRICGVPLVVDLLAPNGRPAQRTQDLKRFWATSYLDVRKDLRARYPKHAWPEDPMAVPEDEEDETGPGKKRK